MLPKHAEFQAFPCAEESKIGNPKPEIEMSAPRESNPHFRPGKAAGCRYIMGACDHNQIVKEREHAPVACQEH